MQAPSEYKTQAGLLRAAERVLARSPLQSGSISGCSRAMWLQNASFVAETRFQCVAELAKLRQRFSVSRPQDLEGGNALFGMPLPTRAYIIGDCVTGVGVITDQVETRHGKQFCISGQWILDKSLLSRRLT